jgi:Taurine catabolism dioxygenase TauD, TfdA family
MSMSSSEAQDDLASPVSLTVHGEFARSIAEIWCEEKFDDSVIHDRGSQAALVSCCVRQLGEAWTRLTSDLRAILSRPPYWAILRLSHQGSAPALLAAIGASLGTLCDPYNKSWSKILQEIGAKKSWTPDLEWHTDSTGWPLPNVFTALSCIRHAPVGGATDLLSLATARAALIHERPDAVRVLEAARFAWPLDADLDGDLDAVDDLILAADRVRFMRGALLQADDAKLRAAVQWTTSVIDSLPPDASVLLRPGDLLVFDNQRTLHRRGEVADPEFRRLLVRVKIM